MHLCYNQDNRNNDIVLFYNDECHTCCMIITMLGLYTIQINGGATQLRRLLAHDHSLQPCVRGLLHGPPLDVEMLRAHRIAAACACVCMAATVLPALNLIIIICTNQNQGCHCTVILGEITSYHRWYVFSFLAESLGGI